MVDEVAQRTLAGSRLERWNRLRRRANDKAGRRNEIAHASIVMHGTTKLEARLHPFWAITTDKPAPKNKGLTAQQLEERAASFTELSVRVLRLYRELQ